MRTVKEMKDFSANYSVIQKGKFALVQTGVKLDDCHFEDVVKGLREDEDVLFCFAALPKNVIALTNQRTIIARDPKLSSGNNEMLSYSYENIGSIAADRRMIKISTTGADSRNMQFGNLQEDKIAEAVSIMQEIVAKYKTDTNAPAAEKPEDEEGTKEIRKLCNACGQIFCYTQADLEKNRRKQLNAGLTGLAAAAQMFSGYHTSGAVQSATAQNTVAQVVDYNRCPKCGSRDLRTLTSEEWAEEQRKAPAPTSAPVSAADELKKFKELLDMGVITQEEFDAKKKQILGL